MHWFCCSPIYTFLTSRNKYQKIQIWIWIVICWLLFCWWCWLRSCWIWWWSFFCWWCWLMLIMVMIGAHLLDQIGWITTLRITSYWWYRWLSTLRIISYWWYCWLSTLRITSYWLYRWFTTLRMNYYYCYYPITILFNLQYPISIKIARKRLTECHVSFMLTGRKFLNTSVLL